MCRLKTLSITTYVFQLCVKTNNIGLKIDMYYHTCYIRSMSVCTYICSLCTTAIVH